MNAARDGASRGARGFAAKLVRLLGLYVVFGSACASELSLNVIVPNSLLAETDWIEVGAYKDVKCNVLNGMLGNGLPEGVTARAAFRKKAGLGPRFGYLPTGSYAFAGVARNSECAVIARGCTDTDTDASQINVNLEKISSPTGQCPPGASCQAGKCTPAIDNDDPSVGGGCALTLLGAGPLLTRGQASGDLSAPAIAATQFGFVVTYRLNGSDGHARVYILPLDDSGGVYGVDQDDGTLANSPELDKCNRGSEVDGVGLAMPQPPQLGDTGLIAMANNCAEGPSMTLLGFKIEKTLLDPPKNSKQLLTVTPDATGLTSPVSGSATATLGAARAAALRTAGGVIVYTDDRTGHIGTIDRTRGITTPSGTFGGTDVTNTWVAANDQVLALLAAVSRGPDAFDDAGTTDPGEGSGSGPPSSLSLQIAQSGTAIESITPTSPTPKSLFSGTWGSLATLGTRVIVLSDGHDPNRSAVYRSFDVNGGKTPVDVGGFAMESPNQKDVTATAGDVAAFGNRAYFAALAPGAIELHVYDDVGNTAREIRKVVFARQTRISGISTIADGRVAVAATDTRVAVAWTTKSQLTEEDPNGGYAVFACTQ